MADFVGGFDGGLGLASDFGAPATWGGCLDSLLAFPIAIEKMRAAQGPSDIPDLMTKRIKECFGDFVAQNGDPVELAIPSIDKLYQNIVSLTMLDLYTEGYCAIVVREFFHQLSCCGVTAFYILDNALRQDRFEAVMHLFNISGVKPISPRTHGADWEELQSQILAKVETGQHAAYIEPDAAVNHLESAVALARGLPCVSTFRNLAPEDPQISIISLGR